MIRITLIGAGGWLSAFLLLASLAFVIWAAYKIGKDVGGDRAAEEIEDEWARRWDE